MTFVHIRLRPVGGNNFVRHVVPLERLLLKFDGQDWRVNIYGDATNYIIHNDERDALASKLGLQPWTLWTQAEIDANRLANRLDAEEVGR